MLERPTSSPSRPGSQTGEPSPPSEPRPTSRPTSRTSLSGLDPDIDRPARVQMIVALLLFLVLVAIPLYLWRRPRAESIASAGSAAAEATEPPPPLTAPPEEKKVTLGDVRIVSCHDPGPKKTPPDQCDHLPAVEQAFARAVEETASCLPKDAGGGTIQYVADISFKRKGVPVATPKEARSLKSDKAVLACRNAVKARLSAMMLDGVPHQHQRYKLSVTASYPGLVKP